MNGASRPIDPAELLANAGNLRALARRLVADDHDADDVVQQTFVAAVERPPRADVPLRPWLARVARNFALRTLRGRRRRAALEAVATPRDAPASPAESCAWLPMRAGRHSKQLGSGSYAAPPRPQNELRSRMDT